MSHEHLTRIRNLENPILITGHTGFKGTWLGLLLDALEISYVGFSLPPDSSSLYNRLNLAGEHPEIFGDVRDYETTKAVIEKFKPSAILHLAAQPLVMNSYINPVETFQTNVMGTVNLLDSAIKTESVKAIIGVTTDKVYLNNENNQRFTENDPLGGKDPYSASKVGTEAALLAWGQISKSIDGPTITSVRAGNVIGGGDYSENRLIPDMVRGFLSDKVVKIRNPKSTRPWQHALDPLVGYLLSLEHSLGEGAQSHNSFNFGPVEDSLTVSEVTRIFGAVFQSRIKIEEMAEETRKTEAEKLDLNSKKAIETLNWFPRWSQKEAIERTAVWWKNYLEKKIDPSELCKNEIKDFLRKRTSATLK
jgi:CDP-glucose 4,6-dehydratase